MKNQLKLLNNKKLVKLSICIILIINSINNQRVFGQRSGYISGDFHQHTTYTDGSYSFDYVMQKNKEFELDWWANSEHGGYREKDGRYSGKDTDTTIYWDTENTITILGDTIYSGVHQAMWRWQIIKDYAFKSTLKARNTFPDKTIIQGLEWNIPGHEHGSVAIISGQFSRRPNAVSLSEFEYRFDNSDKDISGGTEIGWKKSELSGHEKTLEAIEWLQKNHQHDSWIIPAHPERASSYKINHFRDMNNAGPDVCFGFESMPGHQKSSNRGGYRLSSEGGGTYGGCGSYAAKVGGLWDAMLSEGRNWWLFASSDFHDTDGDFWPGEYQKTYTWVTNKHNPYAIASGLRSGNSWIVEGDLIEELDFKIYQKSRWLKARATMGQTLFSHKGDILISIMVNDPDDTNNFGNNPRLDHIDLIMGKVSGMIEPGDSNYSVDKVTSTKVIARFDNNGGITDENGITSIGWKKLGREKIMILYRIKNLENDCYFRLRGTNKTLNEYNETDANGNPLLDSPGQNTYDLATSDLWFYSNPVFVKIHKSNTPCNKYDLKSTTPDMLPELSETDSYVIYPNPANNDMTIINYKGKAIDIIIRDISGKTLKVVQTTEIQSNINISDLPSGLLLITVQSDNRSNTLKVLKK